MRIRTEFRCATWRRGIAAVSAGIFLLPILAAASSIYGRVVDDATGRAVGDASVSVVGTYLGIATHSDGSFRIDGLQEGVYRLRVEHVAHEAREVDLVRVTAGLDLRQDVRLVPATLSMPGIVVESRSVPLNPPGHGAPEAGSIVTRLDIGRLRAAGVGSIGDALATVPGVHVRSSGGAHPTTISLRGAGSARTRVLVDDASVNDPATGIADLGSIPFDEVDRIEVWRGAAAGAAGGFGGVIRIITVSGAQAAQAGLANHAMNRDGPSQVVLAPRISFGSHGASDARFRFTRESPGLSGNITLGVGRTNGDFPVSDPEYPFQDRVNGDIASRSTQAGVARTGSLVALRATASWHETDGGLPGTAEYVTPTARTRTALGQLRLGASTRGPGDALVHASISGVRSERAYVSPRWQEGLGVFPVDLEACAETIETQMLFEWPAPGMSISMVAAQDHFEDKDRLDPGRGVGSVSRNRMAMDASHRWGSSLGDLTIEVQPGLRLDDPGDRDLLALPRLGAAVSWESASGSNWRVTAASGRSSRSPNFNELFWSGDRYSSGNPGLGSELATTLDASIAVERPGGAAAELAAYRSNVEDWIEWQPGATNVWSPQNIGKVRSEGVEAMLRGRLGEEAGWDASVTLQAIRNQDPGERDVFGKTLILRPRFLATAHMNWSPRKQERIDVSVRHVGERPTTRTNTVWLAPYTLIDVQLSRPVFDQGRGRLDAGIGITNLTNQDYRTVPDVYPPPREFRVFADWTWITKAQ